MNGRGSIRLRLAVAVIAVAGVSLGVVATASGADPADAPKYYVDGARPKVGANPQTGEGCVFWSPERTDFAVCGEIDPGWTPPSVPGFHAEACEQAQRVLTAKIGEVEDAFSVIPAIDTSTCFATERSNGLDWFVLFDISNPVETGAYRKVLVAFDVDGVIEPVVSLN
jgi:hypothetical protein